YDNEVDDYKQDHFQLHWNQQWSSSWSSNLALHYTRGRGFFEQYKQDQAFEDYNLDPIQTGENTINSTDLIRRKWLSNHFYGTTFSVNYQSQNIDFIAGGGWNNYEGDHFGDIIWARYASQSEIRDRYYNDNSEKSDFNTYAKLTYSPIEKLSLFGDIQYRNVRYKANGNETGL